MAVSLSALKQKGAKQASASRLAKEYRKQQKRESKRSGWSKFLGGVGGKLLGAGLVGLTGMTGGLAAPLLMAAGSFGGKKMAHDLTKGMGAKTGKLTAGKYGYGGAEATTLREGLEEQLKASDPTKQRGAFGGELLGAYAAAGMAGGLGGAKTLLKGGEGSFGQAMTGQKDWAGGMKILGGTGEIGGLKGGLEGIGNLFDTSFLDKEGDAVIQDELPSSDIGETAFTYDELGNMIPVKRGGGLVQGGGTTPTISDYFGMQGVTLGGSNKQSLSQILGRR